MDISDKKIAVIYGGPSSEAEVSKQTANAVFKALGELSLNAELVEFSANIANTLKEGNFDIVYNAMHGAYGEDGKLAGLLEVLKIPYTHSGVLASSVAMDKSLTKAILEQKGVVSPKGRLANGAAIKFDSLKTPCVIKPVADGSSVGVYIIKNENDFNDAKLNPNENYLIEEFIEGRELSVAVIKGKAQGVVEIRPKSGVYDYHSKYTKGMTEYLVPAPIYKSIEQQVMRFSEIAHNELGCRGVSRSDAIYNEKNGKVYFLEINTHPGMTENSLVPKILKQQGVSFNDLVLAILEDSSLDK